VLDRDMRAIYGTGFFEHVNYRFLEEPGKRVLVVDAIEKSWGLDALRFGLGLSSDFKGDAFFNLIGSYRKYWLNSLGGEWRTDVQVGHASAINTEFYQPLGAKGRFFVAPYAGWSQHTSDVYQGEHRLATYDISQLTAGVSLGVVLSQFGEVRVGVEGGRARPELDTGPAFLSPGDSRISQGAATLRVLVDRIDSVHFPRFGWRSGLSVYRSTSDLGADIDYTKWDADGSGAYSFGEHTFNLAFKFGGKLGSDPIPRFDLFKWGGFLQQSGYATGQLLGENLKFGRLMYYHRILRSSIFEGGYGGASLELGKVGHALVPGSNEGLLRSLSLFVALDSPVGPMYLGHGWGESGNRSWYFYLGRPF